MERVAAAIFCHSQYITAKPQSAQRNAEPSRIFLDNPFPFASLCVLCDSAVNLQVSLAGNHPSRVATSNPGDEPHLRVVAVSTGIEPKRCGASLPTALHAATCQVPVFAPDGTWQVPFPARDSSSLPLSLGHWALNAERALASLEKTGTALTGMAPRSGAILDIENS